MHAINKINLMRRSIKLILTKTTHDDTLENQGTATETINE